MKELVIRYDGSIPICCMDMGNMYRIGHISEGIDALWNKGEIEAARRMLRRGRREFLPCCYCDASLPSQYTIGSTGKYPYADAECEGIVHRTAMADQPTWNNMQRIGLE